MKRIIGLYGMSVLSGCVITAEQEAIRKGMLSDCAEEELIWYRDRDGDGFGGAAYEVKEYAADGLLEDMDAVRACGGEISEEELAGFVQNKSDCNDNDTAVHPEAKENCDTSYDDNCDGDLNGYGEAENCLSWYADADGDGYGAVQNFICDCVGTEEYPLLVDGDCNDLNPSVNPGQEEICGDGIDNNCDSSANSCGIASPYALGESQTIFLGEVSKDYAGARLSSGVLTTDQDKVVAAVLSLEADSALENVGRVDILPISEGEILTSSAVAKIYGVEVSAFGSSLIGDQDIDRDGNHDLLVGASFMSGEETESVGAVSIFSGPLSGQLTMNDYDYHFVGEAPNDRFGASVSIWNGGETRVVVGAPNYDQPLFNGGAVFIFSLSSGSVIQSVGDAVVLDSEMGSSRFGMALSQAEDANGDGIEDIAVGATGYDASKGSAYVFWGEISGNRNAADADVIIRGTNEGEELGGVLDFVGDINGSGYPELAVSALSSNTVYFFSAETAGEYLTADASVVLEGPADSETGYTITSVGDVNGDGWPDTAVGARIASAAYLLYGPLEGRYLLDSDAVILQDSGTDQAGSAIHGIGDSNGDGRDEFLVGAQISSRNAFKSGAVFLVQGEGL